MPVVPGIDTLLASDALRGLRIGLVANPASVNARFEHAADRLLARSDCTIEALFGPQHGFQANLQDNMIETPHARDARRRLPVYSLYSETREPTSTMLSGIDVLVVDLQDIGTRVYTFIYTMANCLRAAGRLDLPVIVLRPAQPHRRQRRRGPGARAGLRVVRGVFPIPMRRVGNQAALRTVGLR